MPTLTFSLKGVDVSAAQGRAEQANIAIGSAASGDKVLNLTETIECCLYTYILPQDKTVKVLESDFFCDLKRSNCHISINEEQCPSLTVTEGMIQEKYVEFFKKILGGKKYTDAQIMQIIAMSSQHSFVNMFSNAIACYAAPAPISKGYRGSIPYGNDMEGSSSDDPNTTNTRDISISITTKKIIYSEGIRLNWVRLDPTSARDTLDDARFGEEAKSQQLPEPITLSSTLTVPWDGTKDQYDNLNPTFKIGGNIGEFEHFFSDITASASGIGGDIKGLANSSSAITSTSKGQAEKGSGGLAFYLNRLLRFPSSNPPERTYNLPENDLLYGPNSRPRI